MAVTDADQLAEVSWRVVENDTTFPSGLWSVSEIAAYFQERQNRFNRDTKLMLAHQPIVGAAGVFQYDMPQDWIATQRVNWIDKATGVVTPMERSDRYAAAHGIFANNPPAKPVLIDDRSPGTLKLEVFPTPVADGSIGLLYASTLEPLNFNPIIPDIFDIPDEFVPYVTYGVLSDMLSKEGRGQDLARAKYCESRYEEGVALAAILLAGWMS